MLLPLLPVGDGGLDGPMLRDRSAEMADEWYALVPGEPGGELLRCIDVGRDGVARGMMSLGSGISVAGKPSSAPPYVPNRDDDEVAG